MMRVRFSLASLISKQLLIIYSPYYHGVLITMTERLSAYETIKKEYDIETLREIRDHGCSSGVANNHIYYTQTVKFFDEHEDELIEYISDTFGDEYNEGVWNRNPNHINGYKNDIVWSYIELVADILVQQYEDITCEEMNETFDEILNSNWGVNHLEIVTP